MIQEFETREEFIAHLPKDSIVAEVGVHFGINAQRILRFTKPKKLYLIDIWKHISKNPAVQNQKHHMEKVLRSCKSLLRKYKNKKYVRGVSWEELSKFEDGYFDWIYIDASHTYEHVKKDLAAAYPKIKKGGWIAGHDYEANPSNINHGVYLAVNEFLEEHNLELAFITRPGGPAGAVNWAAKL